jgi:phosphate transport system permease protein
MATENKRAMSPQAFRESLMGHKKIRLFGLDAAGAVRLFFQSNAVLSVVVLTLITIFLFRDGIGFFPQNGKSLLIYRQAGLEYVDYLRNQVEEFGALTRYLSDYRQKRVEYLTKKEGLPPLQVAERLASLDALATALGATLEPHQTILSEMTDLATAVKEREKVNEDLQTGKENFLRMGKTAEANEIVIEPIDFTHEAQALTARFPAIQAANLTLTAQVRSLLVGAEPAVESANQAQFEKFKKLMEKYLSTFPENEKSMQAWNIQKPVAWYESFTAFAFGRQWLTASFWQDWYGILPLLTGSFMIALIALLIAVPFGVCAAIYVNQVASAAEQNFIKPYIEFIAAIPSVVLGFFGIAILGETLRLVSNGSLTWIPLIPWHSQPFAWIQDVFAWIVSLVPGFPMAERLNGFTAACLLALMSVPTIFSLAEDAINNVPRSFKEASFALGATRLQTILRIIVPASLSGIVSAILLGLGRVVGETMVVLLCAGNRIQVPDFSQGLGAIFQPVHTMTGIIAQELGEVENGSIHYRALFMVGIILFLFSLLVNYLAQKIVNKYRISIG